MTINFWKMLDNKEDYNWIENNKEKVLSCIDIFPHDTMENMLTLYKDRKFCSFEAESAEENEKMEKLVAMDILYKPNGQPRQFKFNAAGTAKYCCEKLGIPLTDVFHGEKSPILYGETHEVKNGNYPGCLVKNDFSNQDELGLSDCFRNPFPLNVIGEVEESINEEFILKDLKHSEIPEHKLSNRELWPDDNTTESFISFKGNTDMSLFSYHSKGDIEIPVDSRFSSSGNLNNSEESSSKDPRVRVINCGDNPKLLLEKDHSSSYWPIIAALHENKSFDLTSILEDSGGELVGAYATNKEGNKILLSKEELEECLKSSINKFIEDKTKTLSELAAEGIKFSVEKVKPK